MDEKGVARAKLGQALTLDGGFQILDGDPVVGRERSLAVRPGPQSARVVALELVREDVDHEAPGDDRRSPGRRIQLPDPVGYHQIAEAAASVGDVAHARVVKTVELGSVVEARLHPVRQLGELVRVLRLVLHDELALVAVAVGLAGVHGPAERERAQRTGQVEDRQGSRELVRTQLVVGTERVARAVGPGGPRAGLHRGDVEHLLVERDPLGHGWERR